MKKTKEAFSSWRASISGRTVSGLDVSVEVVANPAEFLPVEDKIRKMLRVTLLYDLPTKKRDHALILSMVTRGFEKILKQFSGMEKANG